MIPHFFIIARGTPGIIVDIRDEDIHHLLHVLRRKPGDPLILIDRDEKEWSAKIEKITENTVSARLLAMQKGYSPHAAIPALRIYVPIPKGVRAKWMLEKLCEAGVDEVVPLETERTIRLWKKQEMPGLRGKWAKRFRSVCKQSHRGSMPILMDPVHLRDIQPFSMNETGFIIHPAEYYQGLHEHISNNQDLAKKKNISLLVGPEGGFSNNEATQAVSRGWQPARLGANILRVETAAILSVGIVRILLFHHK